MNGSQASWIRAGSLRSLESNGSLVASVAGHTVAIFLHDRAIAAVDNRCPHMGFPLNRGSVADGLLTCHWHHARFDLASGGTLDPFADNVRSYPVRLEGDDVLVDISSVDNSAAYWKRRLVEGLEDGLSLVIAKAVLALRAAGVSDAEIAALAGSYGLSYREGGWNTGMTILTALANVLPLLDEEDRPLALTHGLLRVAQDCAGQPPRFGVEPLPVRDLPLERLKSWFRRAVDVRDEEGSERVLQTVLASGASLETALDMLYAAATDHLFIDGGHEIDFITKAGEYLGHAGMDQAGAALGSLIRGLCSASRSEEAYSWRYPIDLTVLVERGISELRGLWPRRGENQLESIQAFAEPLLGDDPASAISAVLRELERGTSPVALGQAVAYAAALRLARFPVSNEFGDWETVHNTWSSCHALYRALERVPSMELARGILHATMALYLDRFLNVPAAKLPDETSRRNGSEDVRALLSELTDIFSRQQQVHQAAAIVDAYLAAGHDDRQLLAAIGRLTLREDAGFHMYQTLEAGSRLYRSLQKREPLAARRTLVGVVRYLAAHAPTARSLNQTARIAVRLYRGEELFSETPEPAGVE
jgi:nitrite reductase/ring-hydroxylating ferredoxin subunit